MGRFKICRACRKIYFGISTAGSRIRYHERFFDQWDGGYALKAYQYKDGDIVEMILDMEKRTLRYKVNDMDQGIPFENIEKKKYKAAVYMYAHHHRGENFGC